MCQSKVDVREEVAKTFVQAVKLALFAAAVLCLAQVRAGQIAMCYTISVGCGPDVEISLSSIRPTDHDGRGFAQSKNFADYSTHRYEAVLTFKNYGAGGLKKGLLTMGFHCKGRRDCLEVIAVQGEKRSAFKAKGPAGENNTYRWTDVTHAIFDPTTLGDWGAVDGEVTILLGGPEKVTAADKPQLDLTFSCAECRLPFVQERLPVRMKGA